ncbi:MAG: helicase [Deltaproteobacteria bacterium CG11_big_fil_rev_8_21_14_0_20_47_16]|nr:MAG: helicase [Deltaproteobacteria bacterium CG11_big_fil_rev_8_21_14_0_20_47_16]
METQKWLSVEEAAKHLNLGKTLLYSMAQEGNIPANKVGKQWRFSKNQLDEWLNTKKTIKNFFVAVNYNIIENPQLREPQQEGYERIYNYFTDGGKTAIVQLPVGCGKSGMAAIAPFGICKGRVLYIAPNLTIKKELYENLDVNNRQKCFLRRRGILENKDMVGGPLITTLDKSNIHVVNQSHIVVTNIQELALVDEKWLHKFGPDFFDMIIVDEAHHNAASSWQKVFTLFPNAKVLNLTATPFRSDRKEIKGDLVYRYSFREAAIKGYIKKLTASYTAPDEVIVFTADGGKRTYSLSEVIKMKDEEWFSKNIALSEACNTNIVNNSLEKLEKLRVSGTRHQIIAVACSIRHAKQVCSLYKVRGFECEILHSHMSQEDQDRVMLDLRNGRLDCIVQVAMLGEGFDHPKLSVAAIFRPFRSLAPFLQFIGRTMRVVVQNDPTHPDNYGYIVTHVGMNQDTLLKDFRDFEKDDEEFWAKVIAGEDPEPPREVKEGSARKRAHDDIRIEEEIVEHLYEEDVIDSDDEVMLNAIREQLASLGLDPSAAQEMFEKAKRGTGGVRKIDAAAPFTVHPQRDYQEARKRLFDDTKHYAKILLNRCGLFPNGIELQTKTAMRGQNLVIATIILTQALAKKMPNKGPREQWPIENFKTAMGHLPSLLDVATRQLKKALANG